MRTFSLCFSLLVVGTSFATLGCSDSDVGGDGETPRWTLHEVVRIGALDGDAALATVGDVAVRGDVVFVLEMRPPRVVRFDRSGTLLGSFAGPGDGPGELSSPRTIGITGEDLWVADRRGERLEVYSLDGEHRRSIRFRIAADSLGSQSVPAAPLADGSVLAGPVGRGRVTSVLSGALDHHTYYRAAQDGAVLDTLYVAAVPETDFFRATLPDGRGMFGFHPLPEQPLATPFPDGSGLVVVERFQAAAADSATHRLLVFDSAGRTEADVEVAYRPRPAEGWLEGYGAEQQGVMAERGVARPQRRATVDALVETMPDRDFYPPVTRLLAGTDGTIWLRREEIGDTVDWDVRARSGERLGQVSLPTEVNLRSTSREDAWGVVRDSLDVPYLVGYEVERPDDAPVASGRGST